MYCRNCGSALNDKAEICIKCGCRPLSGKDYCQECGAKTTEKQEMCVKCGCMLKTSIKSTNKILDVLNTTNSIGDEVNLDFSELAPYYQKEFQKIYNSGETYKGKFNGWSFFFGCWWALIKGCWLSALIAFLLSIVTAGVGGIIYWFIFGFRGTYMYYCSYVKDKQCIF